MFTFGRYGAFLKQRPGTASTNEQKTEALPGLLAKEGVSASTQNQAFNALLFFYREVLKRELEPVDAARGTVWSTLNPSPR